MAQFQPQRHSKTESAASDVVPASEAALIASQEKDSLSRESSSSGDYQMEHKVRALIMI